MESKYKHFITLIFLLCFIFTFIFFSLNGLYGGNNDSLNLSKQDIINKCNKSNIYKSINCVSSKIKSIYKYNSTNDALNLTFQDLKTRGGDCRNWAKLWINISNDLGYETESNLLYVVTNDNIAYHHRIVIISDKTGYCMAALNHVDCYTYQTRGIENE